MFPSPITFAVLVATFYLVLAIMSEPKEEPMIQIGKKTVPINKVNKPHNVVVGGVDKPIPDLKQFPDLTPEAKAREEKLEAERKKGD